METPPGGNVNRSGKRVQGEVEPRHPRLLAVARREGPLAERREEVVHLPLGGDAGGADAADDDLSELLAMQLEQRPERGVRPIGAAVPLAPGAVIADQPEEGRASEVVPAPLRAERRDRFRRAGQEGGGIGTGGGGRSEPEARDDAEVAAPGAGERPPQLAIRIRRLARRDDDAGPPVGLHGHDLDAVQVVGGEAELAAEETERAAGHVPADADARVLAQRNDHAPVVVERPERLAHRGAGLHGDGAPFRVEGDALHRRDIDDHLDLGIRDEPLAGNARRWSRPGGGLRARRPRRPRARRRSNGRGGRSPVSCRTAC